MTQVMIERDELERMSRALDGLTQQVHTLGEQMSYLTEQARTRTFRERIWDDVQEHALEEIQAQVDLEELLDLLARLARNTRTLAAVVDQLESASDFLHDLSPVTREMMEEVVRTLATLEQKGYFAFARQLQYIVDEIVTSFSEEEVRQLGDNIVLILKTVKRMTQPEIMLLLGQVTTELAEVEHHPEALPTSFFGLLRQLRDPEVRRGMSVALAMLKAVAPREGEAVKINGHSDKR